MQLASAPESVAQPRARARLAIRSQGLAGALLSAPAILYFAVFWVFPFGLAVYYSFTNYQLFTAPRWIGGANYSQLFTADPEFVHSLAITGLFVVVTVVPTTVLALLIAAPISRGGPVFGVYRALLVIPAVMPLVAASVVWIVIYSPGGLANTLLSFIGAPQVAWLTGTTSAYWGLVIMTIWKYLGFYFLIILAGMQTIPRNLYHAAALDGARSLRTFFRITLPLTRRTLAFVIVIGIIAAAQSFVPAYILTQGGPANATELLPLYLYKEAFSFTNMGLASAISVILTVVLFAVAFVQYRMIQGRGQRAARK